MNVVKFKEFIETKQGRLALATIGIVAAIAIMAICLAAGSGEGTPIGALPPVSASREISPEAIDFANEELEWAYDESFTRMQRQFMPVEELFASARVEEFAESCLSWRSKWLLAKDKLFDSSEHAALIEGEFRRCIFNHEELEQLLEQCTKAYLQEMKSVDSDFLVRLSVDWQGLPAGSVPGFQPEALQTHYNTALKRAIAASKNDVIGLIQREAVSFVVSEVMSAALLELGVSSGVLATGAASGWATFGVGLAVGLLVDYGIQQITDPVGKLTFDLSARLEDLRTAILFGDADSPGLIVRLQEFANERAVLRRDTIRHYLFGTDSVAVPAGS